MKETKQQAHREKETPDVRNFTHAIFSPNREQTTWTEHHA